MLANTLPKEFPADIALVARRKLRALARDLAVPANLTTRLLRGETRITARTAILLSGRFGNSAEFWMNLQTAHDLEETRAEMGRAA